MGPWYKIIFFIADIFRFKLCSIISFLFRNFESIETRLHVTASVVWWSEFLATDPEVRVWFPVVPDFLRSSGSGTGSTQELLGRKSSGSDLEIREYGRRGPSRWQRDTLYQQKVVTNVADKRRSRGRYCSLTDSGHGIFFFFFSSQSAEFAVELFSGEWADLNAFQKSKWRHCSAMLRSR
jgi:hypothetical protein